MRVGVVERLADQRKAVNWVLVALLIAVVEDSFGGLYYLVRVFWVPDIAHLNKLVTGSVITFCLISLILSRSVSLNAFSTFMFFGLLLGLVNSIFYIDSVSPSSFISHLTHWALMFICFAASRSVRWDLVGLWKSFRKVVVFILILNALFFLILNVLRQITTQRVYVGSSAEELLMPISWFLVSPNYLLVGIALVLILLSGKRGPLLAAFTMVIFYVFFKKSRNSLISAALKAVLIGTLIISAVGYFVVVYKPSEMLEQGSVLQRAVYKYESSVVKLFSDSDNLKKSLDLATSGRSAEFSAAWSRVVESPAKAMLGNGYGWDLDIFLYDGSSKEPSHIRYHFLHFSPLNIVLLYGGVFALIYYFFILNILRRSWGRLNEIKRLKPYGAQEKAYLFLLLMVIGKLIVSLTAYNVGVDPVFWIMLGILARPDSCQVEIKQSCQS